MHGAAYNGNIIALQWLLEKGQDVNIQDNMGNTPLYKAVENSQLEVVKLLLTNGADVNLRNQSDQTALMKVFSGHPMNEIKLDILDLLMQHDGDITQVNAAGDGVIEYATYHHNETIPRNKALLLLLGTKNTDVSLEKGALNYFASEENVNTLFAIDGYEKHKIIAGHNLHKSLSHANSDRSDFNQRALNSAPNVLELTSNHINSIKPHIATKHIERCNNIYLLRDNELKCEKIIRFNIRLNDFDQDSPFYAKLLFLNHLKEVKNATAKRIAEIFVKNLILPELPEREELVEQLKITAESEKALTIIRKLQAPGMKEVFNKGELMNSICLFLDPKSASNFSYTNKNPLETLISFPDQDILGNIEDLHIS